MILKDMSKSKTYMVKFNVSIIHRLKIIGFFVNTKYIHKHDVILNQTANKLFTIFKKFFFSIPEPYEPP